MVGIDGADRTLLRKWALSGNLPNLAALLQKGASVDLDIPEGFADDAVWACLATGTSLKDHGRFNWQQLRPGPYDLAQSRHVPWNHASFWQTLSDAGRRVAVLDAPKSPLSSELNGIQISDWLVHGRDCPEPVSVPVELAGELPRKFGETPAHFCTVEVPQWSEKDYQAWVDALRTSIQMKKTASLQFVKQEPWDLFLTVFKEAHCSGHHFWHLMDPSHKAHDKLLAEKFGGVIKEIYGAIDDAVGELVRAAGQHANVIVFSPLGMDANRTGAPLMGQLLRKFNARALPRLRLLETGALANLQDFVRPVHRKTRRFWRLSKYLERSLPHRSDTCFELPHNETASALRFNVASRDPNGFVAPGEPLDVLCGTMIRELNGLVDADTGEPLVEKVIRLEDGSSAGASGSLPDLLVVWWGNAPVHRAYAPSLGLLEGIACNYRSGNHRDGGVLFAAGPDIARVASSFVADITDVAPTVCNLLGAHLERASGRPIQHMLTSAHLLSPQESNPATAVR